MILFEPSGLMIAHHQPGYQADQRLRPSCTEGLQTRPTIMTIEGEPFCNCAITTSGKILEVPGRAIKTASDNVR